MKTLSPREFDELLSEQHERILVSLDSAEVKRLQVGFLQLRRDPNVATGDTAHRFTTFDAALKAIDSRYRSLRAFVKG